MEHLVFDFPTFKKNDKEKSFISDNPINIDNTNKSDNVNDTTPSKLTAFDKFNKWVNEDL